MCQLALIWSNAPHPFDLHLWNNLLFASYLGLILDYKGETGKQKDRAFQEAGRARFAMRDVIIMH